MKIKTLKKKFNTFRKKWIEFNRLFNEVYIKSNHID